MGIYRLVKKCARILHRSPDKNVLALERRTRINTITFRFMFMFDILKQEDQHVVRVRHLTRFKKRICLRENNLMSDFLHQSPNLFHFYMDQRKVLWCGLTPPAVALIAEKEEILARHSDKAAEYVTRMLMMSVDKQLPLDKILLFRRDLGLPEDITTKWVHSYPELFKVVRPYSPRDEGEYLELVSWRPEWAITELEKTQRGITDDYDCKDYVPGLLRLAFPMTFPKHYKHLIFKRGRDTDLFQRCEYLSPYAEAKGLKPGNLKFNKRAVAIMHELLSFSIEKKLVIRQLGIFRREFVLPQKVINLLLRYLGIFYVSQKGVVYNVYLNEAYERGQLIEKHPLVMWKEKFQKLVGFYRKWRRDEIERYADLQDEDSLRIESKDDNGMLITEGDRNCTSKLEEEALVADDSEVEIDEIHME